MPESPFRFKQFNVSQGQSAMKVGTDGVLLGAWVRIQDEVDSALDIGTGTGLIALQIAQRCDSEIIDALEIESGAFEQAVENFENSPWSDRLFCYHASLQEFEMEMDDGYDLIVCNPPFFNNSFPAGGKERNLARQTGKLDFQTLLKCTSQLLNPNGTCAFIIPIDQEETFIATGEKNSLYPSRITRVKGSPTSPVKRSLMQMQRKKVSPDLSELIIETSRHVYTEEYVDLVKDFYLKM
jgi:tRNA1Val (adenine37-N6)-methyltransferase